MKIQEICCISRSKAVIREINLIESLYACFYSFSLRSNSILLRIRGGNYTPLMTARSGRAERSFLSLVNSRESNALQKQTSTTYKILILPNPVCEGNFSSFLPKSPFCFLTAVYRFVCNAFRDILTFERIATISRTNGHGTAHIAGV